MRRLEAAARDDGLAAGQVPTVEAGYAKDAEETEMPGKTYSRRYSSVGRSNVIDVGF